jgi:tetratricopeptide (TPR) repeat protein
MSGHPRGSRLAQAERLTRQAEAALAAGRLPDAVGLLGQALQLDPNDRRALRRLGDLHRTRLSRPREAAACYAREARCDERDGFAARALALWRLVLRCDPASLEAHERIGALLVELGRAADARLSYERSARDLQASGLAQEAAIVRAHLAVLVDPGPALPPGSGATAPPAPGSTPAPAEGSTRDDEPAPDDDAVDLAADRFRNARLFHHYGLHSQARQQLEDLLAGLPEHREGRQLLVAVCRALGDEDAASQHLRVVTRLLRRQGAAEVPEPPEPLELPPVEEWAFADEAADDPFADLVEDVRADVERLVDALARRGGNG